MPSLNDEIRNLLTADGPIDRGRLRQLREEYPFFTLPTSIALDGDSALTDEERAELLNSLALNTADTAAVSARVSNSGNDFYPEETPAAAISTDDAISKFITTYGSDDPREEEVLTRMIFNPAPDYAQLLAKEEEQSVPDNDAADNPQDQLIDRFIISSREQGGHFPKTDAPEPRPVDNAPVSNPDAVDNSMLTESLAKSYIRQKKYSKALEIITHLSLNYPEKSIYFADQMRFLRKIVLIEQHKNKQ